MSGFSGNGAAAPVAFVPTDQSGGGIGAFTAVDVQWQQIGNMVHVYGTLTYPATANPNNAVISLPVPVPNVARAQMLGSMICPGGSGRGLQAIKNTSTAALVTQGGAAITNAAASAWTIDFMLIYPAS